MALKKGKSAVKSVGIWGGLLGLGVGLVDIAREVAASGVLPASWHPYVVAASGLLALVGRIKAKDKIESLI